MDSTLGCQVNTDLARTFGAIVIAGWANKSDGHVESSVGHFALVTIAPGELNEMLDAVVEEDWMVAPMPGAYLVCEDTYGNTQLIEYLSNEAAGRAFDMLAAEYAAWGGGED